MVVWLRPECILAIVTSLYYCSQLVSSKTYDKFWCATEEGHHQLSCPDETDLLTDVSIRKVYRRTQMCQPDIHSEYLIHCQGFIDGSSCEGNKTCSIEVSSRNYILCGDKTYAPTYFFVKYTCTQIHTMCADTAPIRNTLYGFIVSPAYPHPMADNLKCSINIEADSSMFIELAPIQIRLQEAIKCRSEYLEIFGYLNSASNDSLSDDTTSDRNTKNVWKSYHTWCGADRSTNNPAANARYLISSNSLYMSLQSAVSKQTRFFKIRYKVVPSRARSQYDSDGIAYDSSSNTSIPSTMVITTSTVIMLTTIVPPLIENNDFKKLNGTLAKRSYKKEIIIGVIGGVILLVIVILAGIGIFLFLKRRRTATTTSKSSGSTSANVGKKPVASPTSTNSAGSKPAAKSSDKAPLLEQTTTTTVAASAAKRKLVPERTVQISDVNTSRFKSPAGVTAPGQTGATGKDTSSTSSEAVATSSAPPALKPTLTAADSGIYGADLSEDTKPVTKPVPSSELPQIHGADFSDDKKPVTKPVPSSEPPQIYGADFPDDIKPVTKPIPSSEPSKIYGADFPDKSEPAISPAPSVTVVVNPLSENPITTENTTLSAIVIPNNITINPLPESVHDEKEVLLKSIINYEHLDETVKSAYSNLIDATMSENEGTIGGGGSSIVSSASQSRRTSNVKQPLLFHQTNNIETNPRKTTQFNPLHMILKKDANKYYTTEYI